MTDIEKIKGTIHMSNGKEIKFYIDEQMWEQWNQNGAYLVQAGTSKLLEMMQKAFAAFQLEGPEQD